MKNFSCREVLFTFSFMAMLFTAVSHAEAQGLGLFQKREQAQQHCPKDTVVWLDLKKRPITCPDNAYMEMAERLYLPAAMRLSGAATDVHCSAGGDRFSETAPSFHAISGAALRRKNFSSIDISEMPDLHEAVRKAQHFADLAAKALTDQQREHYLDMERTWLTLADGWRAIARVGKH